MDAKVSEGALSIYHSAAKIAIVNTSLTIL